MNHSMYRLPVVVLRLLLKSPVVLFVSSMALIAIPCVAQKRILTLEQCLSAACAKENSLVVQMAKIEVLECQLNLQEYEKRFQFKLLGTSDFLHETTGIETGNSEFDIGRAGVGIAASKILYDGNGLNQAIDFGQLKLEEAKVDLINLTKKVHRDVIEVFFGIFESELRLGILRLEYKKNKIKEEEAYALFESGQNYRIDFLEERFKRLNIENDLVEEEANKNELIHRLSRLMGGSLIEPGTLLAAEIVQFYDNGVQMVLDKNPYSGDFLADKSRANSSGKRRNGWQILFNARTGFNVAKDFSTDESMVSGGNALIGLRIEFPVFNREQSLNQAKLMRAVHSNVRSKIESQKSENHLNWSKTIRDLQLNQKSLSLIQKQKEILETRRSYVGKMKSKGDKSRVDLELQDLEQKKIELDFQMKLLESNRLLLFLYGSLFKEFHWEDWTAFVEENSEDTFTLRTHLR
jgi:outer membrane protein TolC